MKEVMAVIRMNMVTSTKIALANSGYPAFFCRKCLGRGKKAVIMNLADALLDLDQPVDHSLGEHLTEAHRLISKRIFTLMVDDGKVDEVVRIIIETNQTGNPGDGRIFILPVMESYNVRTGQAIG